MKCSIHVCEAKEREIEGHGEKKELKQRFEIFIKLRRYIVSPTVKDRYKQDE